MSAWPSSSSETAFVATNVSSSTKTAMRAGGQTSSQPSGSVRASLQVAEGRPHGTGLPQAQSRSPAGLPVDTREDDGVPLRATQSSQSGHARDSPLRNSKDGRPASRSSSILQSPYLQPPVGRATQSSGHRPASRTQSQQSPQPQHPAPPIPASTATSGTPASLLRRSTNTSSGTGSANGDRIFQAYGTPVLRPYQSITSNSAPQPSPKQPQPSPQGRPTDQQHQHQQDARAVVAQQQQQQAGPRATTALSGARSMQRGTGSGPGPGSGTVGGGAGGGGGGGDGGLLAAQAQTGFRSVPAASAVAHHLHHHHHPLAGGPLGSGHGGLALYADPGASASFGYDDIPEEDDESMSPVASDAALSGLTLDQYMQRMVTTPASAAATSGLGVSADSGESAPCSPGNASTRTEEEDSPHSSPYAPPMSSSPSMGRHGRHADGGVGGVAAGAAARRVAGVLVAAPSPSPADRMPRFSTGARTQATAGAGTSGAIVRASGTPSGSGGLLQRVGSSGSSAGAVVGNAGGARISVTNAPVAPLMGRGPTSLGAGPPPPGRGGAVAAAAMPMYDDVYSGGGAGAEVSALLGDGGSSDDDPLNPSVLLDAPRSSRRLSSRASAMAFSNSLDLRPATAAVVSSCMSRGDPNTPRSIAIAAESSNHHAIIKQVDLGGLSASLFTPTGPNGGRETSGSPASTTATNLLAPSSADLLASSNSSSPDLVPTGGGLAGRPDRRAAAAAAVAGGIGSSLLRPTGPSSGDHAFVAPGFPSPGNGGGGGTSGSSGGGAATGLQKVPLMSPKTSMSAIPPPWGVSAREGAFGGGPAGDGAAGVGSLQALASRPLSSRGRPSAVAAVAAAVGSSVLMGADGVVLSPAAAAATAAAAARPGSSGKWAKPQQQSKPPPQQLDGGGAGPPVMDLPPEAQLLAAEAQGVPRPPTRQVQSARPPGSRGEVELDPSVWQASIAAQLQQRPPSRQKPPPEALHLWTPEQQMGMLASGVGAGLGRHHLGGSGGPGGGGGGGRPLGARPQSAAPATYRARPSSGPRVKAQGLMGEDMAGTSARPPSRQKPPPLSTLLEHDDFPPPPPPGSRRPRPGTDVMDVVVSNSEDEPSYGDLEDSDDELDL